MKNIILSWIIEIKRIWGGFTIIGKATLFPLLLIAMAIIGGIVLVLEAMDECWDAFKRVSAKTFLKP